MSATKMGLSDNVSDLIYKKYQELCNTLNMDSVTMAQAWDSYESIKQHYTLEGDPLHWLGCAIYVACRKTTTPTVGQIGCVVKGNCVSLTRLLRLCNFSLSQFFNKSKKWADMANMPTEFHKRIERLERNFAVTVLVFKKYHVIFNEIFLAPVDEPKQHRSRKQRNLPCTPSRIFEFCWTLFVCIKGEFTACSDDLVTSFHLLLACCDMAYSNALLADRRDLLNPNFAGLPKDWSSPDYIKPETPPCIIDILCQNFNGIIVEAKCLKEYSWKKAVTNLFNKNILQGDIKHFTGLFDATNFDNNIKAVNKVYEEHVLNVGEFDEKIFLDGDINSTIGSPNRSEEKAPLKRNLTTQYEDQIQQLVPATPLTGRKYLRGRDGQRSTPLASATQSLIRLQTMLNGRKPEPSAELLEIFNTACATDPNETIKSRVKQMGEQFISHYIQQADAPSANVEYANKRLVLAESLYYKLLENVLGEERKRNPNLELSTLIDQDIFHRCMFACSIEIVIHSYNYQRNFPWIIDTLGIKGFYFYRVIELIVRTKDQLSRDVVKHLNSIEEQILESIAWESDSPIWDCIEASNQPVPSCEDTSIPGLVDDGTNTQSNQNAKKIQPSSSVPQSPVTPAAERFQSPIPNSIVKKKLFVDPQSAKVKPGQSLLQSSTVSKTVAIDLNNDSTNAQQNNTRANQPKLDTPKPKRNGSLALFFRKFYNLAGVRMEELCNQLNVKDMDLKRKIFTCFEHCIIENTDLMKDRHLDQILMCAVYVVCKVSRNEKSFTEIMRCYRLQPQADSHVYRSVLMHKKSKSEIVIKQEQIDDCNQVVPVKRANPNELTGRSTSHDSEDRGDLIKFYNTVYIQRTQNFALRFSNSQPAENLHLSPLPVNKHLPCSPKRRVIENVYVRPYEQTLNSPNAVKQYSYYFSRSPSKDLKDINSIINSRVGKRLLKDEEEIDEDVTPIKKIAPPTMTRKLQGLIEERLVLNKE